MTHFKTTETIREEMVGNRYKNERGDIVTVLNVIRVGSGHQVHFNYGAPYNVIDGLTKFRKRYPHKVDA